MQTRKKEFQQTIKEIRDNSFGGAHYPKAQMTAKQMDNGTATVNCGDAWNDTQETAHIIINHQSFQNLIIKWNAHATLDTKTQGGRIAYQIRINWSH